MTNLPTEYAALGFDFDDFDDLMEAVMDVTDGKGIQVPGYMGAVSYQDPSGARLTAFQQVEGGWTTVLGFSHSATSHANAYRVGEHLGLFELREPGAAGMVFNRVAAAADESFVLPAGNPAVNEKVELETVELAAAAMKYTLYDDVAAWKTSPDNYDSPVPAMLYSASVDKFYKDFSPLHVGPYARLIGQLVSVDERTNELSGQKFYACGIQLPSGVLAVALPADAPSTQPVPRPGQVFAGRVMMLGGIGFWASRSA